MLTTPTWEKIATTKKKTTIIGILCEIYHVTTLTGTKSLKILFPQTKLTKKTKTKITKKTE